MAISSLLITSAMYMQLELLSSWFTTKEDFSPLEVALIIGIPGIGVFSLGCFCSYFIERYRRNVMCLRAIFLMIISLCVLSYLYSEFSCSKDIFIPLLVIRFFLGAAFGFSQMVLSSTLIIDTCESFQRTEANHSAGWFSRFAISLGPVVALCLLPLIGISGVIITSIVILAIAVFLILLVRFPFKAPEEKIYKVSLDRFFLPKAKFLFLNLLLLTIVIGIVLSQEHSLVFYCMLMVGFFLALLSQRFVFVNANLKSEVITGIILLIIGLLLKFSRAQEAAIYFSPTFIGCAIGLIGARFLLFFVKLSQHCQRGTSQSTFFLSWEIGIYLGLFIGYCFLESQEIMRIAFCILLSIVSLIMYVSFTHKWYISNKSR